MDRRQLITGLISLVAAPAIVRAGSLMPVRSMIEPNGWVRYRIQIARGRYLVTYGKRSSQIIMNEDGSIEFHGEIVEMTQLDITRVPNHG